MKSNTKPLQAVSWLNQAPDLNANTRNVSNKKEELEMCTHLQSYDLIGIMEMWWDASITGVLESSDTGSAARMG